VTDLFAYPAYFFGEWGI